MPSACLTPTPSPINAATDCRPTVASQSAHFASSSDAIKSRLKDVLNRVEGQRPTDPAPLTQNSGDNCISYFLMVGNDNLQECHALLCQIEAALGG